jgi:hypothetical protein
MHNLYIAQRVKLHLNQGENESVEIGGGVRQGLRKKELLLCVCENRYSVLFVYISMLLFSLFISAN